MPATSGQDAPPTWWLEEELGLGVISTVNRYDGNLWHCLKFNGEGVVEVRGIKRRRRRKGGRRRRRKNGEEEE